MERLYVLQAHIIHSFFQVIVRFLKKQIVFMLVIIGILVRVSGFPDIPYGLNQDEVATAYAGFTLLHEGVEPWYGYSFPVNLLTWDVGSPILGALFQIPSILIWGLTEFSIRLPYLLIGCLTLPLFYLFLRNITDRLTAILGLFLIVISPWHISISRWALDANILPPLLLIACLLFTQWMRHGLSWYLYSTMLSFALCLYAYGPAFVVVNGLIILLAPIAIKNTRNIKELIGPSLLYLLLAAPISIYILMNTNVLPWDTLTIGPLTIPRLTVTSRFLSEGFFGHSDKIGNVLLNLRSFFDVMLNQNDHHLHNALPRFGMIYGLGMFFAMWGIVIVLKQLRQRWNHPSGILMSWTLASVLLAPLLVININRINAIVLPLIAFAAIGLRQLIHRPLILRLSIVYFVLWFLAFIHSYFIDNYQLMQRSSFQDNFFGAIQYATEQTPTGPICITDRANAPFIYVAAAAELPSEVFRNGGFLDGEMDRFSIGLQRCNPKSQAYVISNDEFIRSHQMFPVNIRQFGNFVSITADH